MSSTISSILRIIHNGQTLGTGFLISENLIVTCAHVIVGIGDSVTVQFSGREEIHHARIAPEYLRSPDNEDIAFLHLDSVPKDVVPLKIAAAEHSHSGNEFLTMGYPEVGNIEGVHARGLILGMTAESRQPLLQLRSSELNQGHSGAPVFDMNRRGVVVGMVVSIVRADASGRLRDAAYAIPSEALQKIVPKLAFSDICPYRSLDVFTDKDDEFFCGRQRVIESLLKSLRREPRFLAVLGPSGSGKSSVVQAGLVPELKKGKLSGSKEWGVLTVRPGEQPFEQLADVGLVCDAESDLVEAVKGWLASHPGHSRLVLVIDQFEELLVNVPEDLRQTFITQLTELLDEPVDVSLVLTMRDDFYSRFQQMAAPLAPWLERGLINIPNELNKDELREIVLSPAKQVGLRLEDGLEKAIIADALETGGNARSTILPLLEFTLTQLWEERQDGSMCHDAYRNLGGVSGGLSQWADRAYYHLNPNERTTAHEIFCHLVHLGDEKEQIPDTRRVISKNELAGRIKKSNLQVVIEKIIKARLLSVHRDTKSQQELIEIIHESLLHEWKLLGEWLDDFRHQEQRLREQRRRFMIFGLSIVSAVMIMLTFFAIGQRNIAHTAESTAQAERDRAEIQAQISRAGELAALSLANHDNDPYVSLLLGIEAYRTFDNFQTRSVLFENFEVCPKLRQYLRMHTYRVSSVAFSPDGKVLASGDLAGTIILWDAQSGQPIGEPLKGFPVRSVAFSPNGKVLASGGDEGSITLWDVQSGQPIGESLAGHTKTIRSVTFSPDGKVLASGSYDRSIILWDLENGQPIGEHLRGHTDVIYSMAFNPDGEMLASGSEDGTIILWDVKDKQPIGEPLRGHTGAVYGVAFSPDGEMLASGSEDESIILWDVERRQPIGMNLRTNSRVPVHDVAFSPDGRILASASNGINLWDVQSGQPTGKSLKGHTGLITSVVFSPDGETIASGSWDDTVILWDVDGRQAINQRLKGHVREVTTVAFSPDGKILTSRSYDRSIILWDVKSGRAINKPLGGINTTVYSLAFSEDGGMLISGTFDDTIIQWDLESKQPISRHLKGGKTWAINVIVSKDGKTVASVSAHEFILLWDKESGQPLHEPLRRDNVPIRSVAFSPGGKVLASGSENGSITLWDVGSGQPNGEPLVGLAGPIYSVVFSPDGKVLASGSRSIILWDVENGQPIGEPLTGHAWPINSLAFSPDGKVLASGGVDGAIILWDLENGLPIGESLKGHTSTVYSIAFSPNGKILASGSEDKSIILWEVDSRKPIGEPLSGHSGGVRIVDFSPDGKTLVSSDRDTVSLWDVESRQPIENFLGGSPPLSDNFAFSQDGKILVTTTEEGDKILWDVESGQQMDGPLLGDVEQPLNMTVTPDGKIEAIENLRDYSITLLDVESGRPIGNPLTGHTESITSFTFSPDGNKLATGSLDHTIMLWDVGPQSWISISCDRVRRNFTREEWATYFPNNPYPTKREDATCPQWPLEQEPTATP